MCGRYQFTNEKSDVFDRLQELAAANFPDKSLPNGDVYPSQSCPVLVAGERKAELAFMDWGMQLDKKLLINARSETAAEKPMFAEAFRLRRCVVVSTGYYEWDSEKRKFLFRLPDSPVLYMCGLYTRDRFVILTRQSFGEAAAVHHRMPVIASGRLVNPWLKDIDAAAELIRSQGPAPVAAS